MHPLQRPIEIRRGCRSGGLTGTPYHHQRQASSRILLAVLCGCCCFIISTQSLAWALSSNNNNNKNRQCVVVGGGPVGLAAALTLSRPPHQYDVTLLEQSASGVGKYNPARAYLYNVNSRGLEWFTQHDRALQKLQQHGVAQTGLGLFVVVPADPKVPINLPKATAITNSASSKPNNRTSYWIPRHTMVQVLTECCEELQQQRQMMDETNGKIEICYGKCVDTLTTTTTADEQDQLVVVHCQDGSTFTADLVVAADGIDSQVRQCLASTKLDSSVPTDSSWLRRRNPSLFRVRHFNSPSSGIKLKAIQLPPNFTFTDSDGSIIASQSSTSYVFRGVNQGSRNRVSLGCLPMRDASAVRPANTNTPFDHELWSLHTGPQAKAWFVQTFPRLPWDDWIDDAEWERFAKEAGTTFPRCQYSPGSAVSNGHNTGIVMVGDACHAFPPDIGQGINAGLQDVVVLDRALRGCDLRTGGATPNSVTPPQPPPPTLAQALETYQRNRGPEHRALIRLARFGAPYQYRQPWKRHRVGRILWTANVLLRTILNKLTLGVVPPAAIVMAQGNALTFRQVMRRADAATWALRGLVLLPLMLWWRSKFG